MPNTDAWPVFHSGVSKVASKYNPIKIPSIWSILLGHTELE